MLVSLFVSAELALALIPRWVSWRFRAPDPGDVGTSELALLGDSVTFGFGVPPADGWGARLPDALDRLGIPGVRVFNLAQPATGIRSAVAAVSDRGPDGATFLAMIGHNDFVRWNNVLNTHQPVAQGGLPTGLVPWTPRVFRLGWYLLEGQSPEASLDPGARAEFHTSLLRLIDAVDRRGGHLALLTYAVPGPPGPDAPVDPSAMQVVHDGQIAINRLIRTEAAAQRLPVIDVEGAVAPSASWSNREFLDVIHPTSATHQRIADAVAKGIIDEAILRPPG